MKGAVCFMASLYKAGFQLLFITTLVFYFMNEIKFKKLQTYRQIINGTLNSCVLSLIFTIFNIFATLAFDVCAVSLDIYYVYIYVCILLLFSFD